MKDKILATKAFVKRHRHVVVYSTGIAVGSYVTYTLMRGNVPRTIELFVKESPDEIKQALENNGGFLPFNVKNLKSRKIILYTGVDPSFVK